MSLYEEIKKEIQKTGWVKLGYDEKGRLVQYNIKTKGTRFLDNWVEIVKD